MRRLAPVLALLALASAATPTWGQAQEELSLAICCDFGYRSGDRIQGRFTLQAVGTTASGMSVRSPERNVQFVSADESWAAGVGIAAPLGIGVAAVIAVGVLLPGLVGRRRRILRRQDTGMPGSAPDSGSEDEEQRLLRSIENSKYLE